MSSLRSTVRVRVVRFAVAVAMVVASGTAFVLPTQTSLAAATDSSFTGTVEATRTHVVTDPSECVAPATLTGTNCQVEDDHVTLKVDRTVGLQDQQQIRVSWTGAHPTSNYAGDPNASNSDLAEHPMVLLQCRGTAATVTPETCWAPLGLERQSSTGAASGAADVGTFPPWRLDRYAVPADRAQFTGIPASPPHGCRSFGVLAQRVVPFVAADGTHYYGSGQFTACGASPPEAASFSTSAALPDNATFALTNADGSGSDKFSVRDLSSNASLGCSAAVACALVAIPVVGISCDPSLDADDPNNPDDPGQPANAAAACAAGALWPTGYGNQTTAAWTVSGTLWWSASNWRNRLVVPLTFAPVLGACGSLNDSSDAPAFFGAESAMQATTQWSAKLCQTQGASSFDHVISAEPLARTLVSTGAVTAALASEPPSVPYLTPTVQAPVAATGFAISYIIDDVNGNPYQSLRLTPRLLAKLMTESYPDTAAVRQNYPALSGNPLNITQDPEFQALNPGVPRYTSIYGTASLFSISTPSDVMYALTSYISADPEAMAWLRGAPDPWGMVVNPNYKGLSLPLNAWPLADSWMMPASAYPSSTSIATTCEGQYGVQPQPPYLQLIANPIESMLKIAQSIEYAQPGDANACTVNAGVFITDPFSGVSKIYTAYTRAARQFTGQRFAIGLTSLADAVHYSLDTAALETISTADPTVRFADGTNRNFAAPTDDNLKAAFALLEKNSSTGFWTLPYATLRKTAPSAYPGAMLVYAIVPTSGLSAPTAKAYASAMNYMIGPGQVPGSSVGELPDGYVPITAANGMSALAAYTTEAVTDVAKQQGLLPGQQLPTVPVGSGSSAAPIPSAPAPTSSVPTAGTQLRQSAVVQPPAPVPPSPSIAVQASKTPSTAQAPVEAVAKTVGVSSGTYQWLVILLLVLLAVGPIAAPVFVFGRRRRLTR